MRKLRNQKGLLIFTLALVAFVLGIQLSLLGMIELTLSRVNGLKRRETAKSLSEMGERYARFMSQKQGENFLRDFNRNGKSKIEFDSSIKNGVKYTYQSEKLVKDGTFTLTAIYRGEKLIKLISTGNYEGITYSREFKLR